MNWYRHMRRTNEEGLPQKFWNLVHLEEEEEEEERPRNSWIQEVTSRMS